MSLDAVIASWREVRRGLVEELALIPENQLSFRATPQTRSVEELIRHIVEAQKVLIGETCRPDSNLSGRPFPEMIREYAPEVESTKGKDGFIELLRASMDWAESGARAYGEAKLDATMKRFDGKDVVKVEFLQFTVGHEMYHRGQLTVFQRLMNIEPALTARFRKMAEAGG